MKRSLSLLVAVLMLLVAIPQADWADGPPALKHKVRQPRPIRLGTSGGNVKDIAGETCSSGTLGGLIRRGGNFEILSNNHVLALSNQGTIGDDVTQPGLIDVGCEVIDKDIVGDLSAFEPVDVTPGSTNTVDAATAKIRTGKVKTDGSILDIGRPSSLPTLAVLGMKVKKSGRTTGLTRGRVTGVNVTINIEWAGGTEAKFVNQIEVTRALSSFSKAGDSGSLIVEDKDTCPRPVGLLFAGNRNDSITWANRIQKVLTQFDATIVGCPPGEAAAESSAEEVEMSPEQVAEAVTVQEGHTDALLQIPGVVGTAIGWSAGDGRAVIKVYLREASPALEAAIPLELEGVQVTTVVTGRIFAH